MEILDEVMTEEGPGIVVGFPAGDVEVRYPNEGRRLKIWPRDTVSLVLKEDHQIQSTGTYQAQAMSQGVIPVSPREDGGDDAETIQAAIDKAADIPRGKTGRKLSGAALAKHRAKQERS